MFCSKKIFDTLRKKERLADHVPYLINTDICVILFLAGISSHFFFYVDPHAGGLERRPL